MLVTDYDILVGSDGNGYARDFSRAYHSTIVWEPKKLLVPVTGTTVPSTGIYVVYNPSHRVTVTPQFNLEVVDGPQGHSLSGNTTMLDRFILWEFDNGKLAMIGDTRYLAYGPQSGSPDTGRDALLASTGVTVTLNDAGVPAGEVYPEIALASGNFRLGFTATGPNGHGVYTYYGPKWYNANLACYPDEYLILYKVENAV